VTLESESGRARDRPQHLNERQLDVWRALRSKATSKFRFHDWYLGALAALAQPEDVNPDRLAQAANSLREILEKIPRALETEVSGVDRNILEQSRKSMATAIAQAKADYQNGWAGEITQQLKAALEKVDQYSELRSSPTRAERTFAGLAKLDPMIDALPDQSQQRKRRRYGELAKKFEQFTHHHCDPDEQELRNCIAQAEDLILDLMAPISADDQNLLSEIIAQGEAVGSDRIQAALQLIDRRGANLAFFFQNAAHSVWLNPLQEAGYFADAPSIRSSTRWLCCPFLVADGFFKARCNPSTRASRGHIVENRSHR
jgi:hypothetical protein